MSNIKDQPPSKELVGVKNDPTEIEHKDNDDDHICGLGGWKPAWLQTFATAQFFVINFCIVAILQGALLTYLVSIISTLEKRYAFDSKVSGFILITDNLSEMVLSPVFGYLGSKYNRSKLIAIGELIVALSCLIAAAPYFLYGPGLHLLSKPMSDLGAIGGLNNQTQFDLCNSRSRLEECPLEDGVDSSWWMKYLSMPVIILWLFNLANGCGFTAFYTLGLPYVDDNIKKSNSSIYFSSISTIKLLGPMLGYVLASVCLSFYENPFIDPGITNHDPRWIGAWWLGFLILGIGILIFNIPMFLFPKTFRDEKQGSSTSSRSTIEFTKLKDAWDSFKRIATNKVLICHTISSILRVVGFFGYYINKPKYMELQYRQSASSASFFTGATSVITMAVGTMVGGLFIKRYRPSARTLAILITAVESYAALNFLLSSMLKCPTPAFEGLEWIEQPSAAISSCGGSCECSNKIFQPICAADGVTNYLSPCYAGCKNYNSIANSSKYNFSNCSCIASNFDSSSSILAPTTKGQAESGLCGTTCNMFVYFVALHSFSNLIGSLIRTGDLLLMLRCVEPRDKNFSLGITGFLFCLFGFIPNPLIFGAVIDSTCLVWKKTCGGTGNCWLYDIDKFRIYLHYTSLGFVVLGLLFEVGTVMYASRIKSLYEDDEDQEGRVEAIEMKASIKTIEEVEM